MSSLKYTILLISCIVIVTATPLGLDLYQNDNQLNQLSYNGDLQFKNRLGRSPQGGSLDLGYSADNNGREASLQYNHNLYTSNDGRGSVDAYAQGSRNFDENRNNFGGGIVGSWRF